MNLKNAYITLNSDRYPAVDYNLSFLGYMVIQPCLELNSLIWTNCLRLLKTKLNKCTKRDTLLQPTQSKSALKNFAIQHQIKGSNGYDPESFLLNSKQSITNLMINTRQTKVKLILSCMMEKVDLKSGEMIAKEAAFHSKAEVT